MNKAPKMGAPATMLNDDIVSIRPTLKSLHERHARAAGRALDRLLAPSCTCQCAQLGNEPKLPDIDWWAASGMSSSLQKREWAGRQLAAAGWSP